MQAVFFLDGDAVDLIGPLKEVKLESILTADQISKIRPQISATLDQLESEYPGTFQNFKTNITSGNHLLIEETIRSNARLLMKFFNENEAVNPYSNAIKSSEKPLALLIDEHFPDKDLKISASEVKEVLSSPNFRSDFSAYFASLDRQLGKNSKATAQDVCVTVGAAVVVVASIAVLVIYVVAILTAASVAVALSITWGDDEEDAAAIRSSLMRDDITNSIAVNWANID